MHILFLTDNFPPEVNAPATRTFEHCKRWVELGNKVTVITCAPNFPKGQILRGYKNKLTQTENMNDIQVIRVWTYISANEGFFRRIIDYLSFMIMAFFRGLFVREVDIIVGTSPQFFTSCSAFLLSIVKRKPWVFELRDFWPESIRALGQIKNNTVYNLLVWLEEYLYKKSNLIIVVTNSFKNVLISRGIDKDKIFVVTNGVNLKKFSPKEKNTTLLEELDLKHKFVVGYIGTIGLAHSVETILSAAKLIINLPQYKDIKFLIVGDGARKKPIENEIKKNNLKNVILVDLVLKGDIQDYWSLLDISVIHLKKNILFHSVIPSKLFECMSMGIPILHGVEGESAEIILEEKIGNIFIPEDPKSLCNSIIDLKNNEALRAVYRSNGINAAKKYNRDDLSLKMLNILKKFEKL